MQQTSAAWSPFEPKGSAWNVALAGHLLRRTTFGFTSSQLQQALNDGPAKTLDRLLAPPPDYAAFEQSVAILTPPEAGSQDSGEVWLYRMRNTPYPFLEKATLFWHGFFGVAGSRVSQPLLMERHLQLLRKHALGRFDALLAGVAHDPAALVANGPPALIDPSIAPEAFSGVTVLRGEYHYDPARHHGNLTLDDAVRNALSQPATAESVVRRICRWLLGAAELSPSQLAPLAAAFARDYDIARLTSTILRSNYFFSPSAYRQDIKSPADFALNLSIALDSTFAPAQLHAQLAALGMRLPNPPSRDGWPGGRRWLNAFTIVGRSNLAATLIAQAAHDPDRRALLETLLQNDAPPAILQTLEQHRDTRDLAQAIANLPEFQLA
jgi:uncharacterized protein (DUF1800 family)